MTILTRSRATLLCMCLAVPSALAQAAPPPGATAAAAHTRAPVSLEEVDRHIRQLHDQLKITPAEQPQWDQFAQVMHDNASQMGAAVAERADDVANMNAADNMQSYAKLAQVHADNMQKLSSAFKALYDSFPQAQRQLADGVFKAQARQKG